MNLSERHASDVIQDQQLYSMRTVAVACARFELYHFGQSEQWSTILSHYYLQTCGQHRRQFCLRCLRPLSAMDLDRPLEFIYYYEKGNDVDDDEK